MKFGWKPSSGNLGIEAFTRSGTIVKLGSTSASNQYVIPEHTPISNQFDISSCVANACCDMWEILYGLENPNNVFQLSRLFLYWNARLCTQDTDKDDGTYIHNAMNSLTKTGVCREDTWPYITSKVFTQPNEISYKEGDDNTFNSFYQIISFDEERLNDIEAAIRANHPVIFGTRIGVEWKQFQYGSDDVVFDFPKKPLGGHAMLIVGIRLNSQGKREFLIRNSWGKNWGLQSYPGHGWFSSDYITADETSDIFVGTLFKGLLL